MVDQYERIASLYGYAIANGHVGRRVLMKEFGLSRSDSEKVIADIRQSNVRSPELKNVIGGTVRETGGGNVLIIGDTHLPFTHPDYLDFCRSVRDRFNCDSIIHVGDEIDNHALSYHEHDPDGYSAGHESDRAIEELRKWYEAFPEVKVMVGNHSALPYRQAFTSGIPRRFLKTYEEAWEAPDGWVWMNEYEKDGVLYSHGIGSGGANGAINRAIQSRQSVVIGHSHSFGGVQYHSNGKDIIFGLNVGCGIDEESYAMVYGKPFVRKPTLGCGVVLNDGMTGFFVPMPL